MADASQAETELCPLSDAIRVLLFTSFSLFAVSCLTSQLLSSSPLSQLGVRPMGRGVWTYLLGFMKGVGVSGYDVILGCHSPPLRVSFHISLWLALWSAFLAIYSASSVAGNRKERPAGSCGVFALAEPDSLWVELASLVVYIFSIECFYRFSKGVADPGGPKKEKIQRVPCWDDKSTHCFDNTNDDGGDGEWRFVASEESHQLTESMYNEASKHLPKRNGEATLTGETSGRDVWIVHKMVPATTESKLDEHLVEKLACGGREKSFNPSKNPNSCDQIHRAQMIKSFIASGGTPPSLNTRPKTVKEAAKKAIHFYSMLQSDDGHWAGDYGGPHFLMPGLVVSWYVMGKPESMLNSHQRAMMIHYLLVHQQSDGGWGTHIESPSTMFGTVLCYVAIRLLGVSSKEKCSVQAVKFIHENGGALYTSSWAKFSLCLLGCMEWDGHNSVPAEMWLLPNWFPFHPGRMWCHCRMVYLPMGYLYGVRFVYPNAETDPLILSLRTELYCEPYETIPWMKTRHFVAPMDNYSPIPPIMAFVQNVLARYESWSIFQPIKNFIRANALAFCVKYMEGEDLQTNFIDIGPVNKVFNLISMYHASGFDLSDSRVQNHILRVPDYLWLAEDGLKMKGYNGSQSWDTSFAIQAVAECDLLDEFPSLARKGWTYMERTQILSTETSQATAAYKYEEPASRNQCYRHISKGGWPFSTSAHGWPIADCTGEGLKAVLALSHSKSIKNDIQEGALRPIDVSRLQDAINVLLTYQNEDGGWATYENNRGYGWYESLNPSEVFGDIMIDYSYVELSMASMTAIVEFHQLYPSHRAEEVKHSIQRGREFIKSIQRSDGSWYGSWACCFCYACWFGIEGLTAAGEPISSPSIQQCCRFLLSHQQKNGGWGEDFTSCFNKEYAKDGMKQYGDGGSSVVNTAWALMALSAAKCDEIDAIRRGVRYLLKRQLDSGDWPQEGISGVFNRACGITYTSYRNVFPIWALGRCSATYGSALDEE